RFARRRLRWRGFVHDVAGALSGPANAAAAALPAEISEALGPRDVVAGRYRFSVRPIADRRNSPRTIWLMTTATTMIAPTATSCQKAWTLRSTRPLRITEMIRMPPSVPTTLPAPPIRDVPPTTAAAT